MEHQNSAGMYGEYVQLRIGGQVPQANGLIGAATEQMVDIVARVFAVRMNEAGHRLVVTSEGLNVCERRNMFWCLQGRFGHTEVFLSLIVT